MESLLIRKLSIELKAALRQRSALHGHSMEEEARIILGQALALESKKTFGWATAFREELIDKRPADLESDLLLPKRQDEKDTSDDHRLPRFD